MSNPETSLTLDEAVEEVLGLLTGLDLVYDQQLDRYRSTTRALNRALRANALEHEWSYYNDTISAGAVVEGATTATLTDVQRPRIMNDDAVRLVDEDGVVRAWAYFLPRDALHKYGHRSAGLWVASRRETLMFSRPFYSAEEGWDIQVPVMREPTMFRLPATPEETPDPAVLAQEVDFAYPDVIVARAPYMIALTDPVMQPRAQTLEANYKDLMYQAIERDDRMTDSPYENEFFVPVQNGIHPESSYRPYPLADERR